MIKKLISLISILAICFNTGAIVFANGNSEDPVVEFAYYRDGYYIGNGQFAENKEDYLVSANEKFLVGKTYYFEVSAGYIDYLQSFVLPIKFNPDVVEIVNYSTNPDDRTRVEDIILTYDDCVNNDYCNYETNGIIYDSKFQYESWYGGYPILGNGVYTEISNETGYISNLFMNDAGAVSILGKNAVFTVCFRVKAEGDPGFNQAKEYNDDGSLSEDRFDYAHKEGFTFAFIYPPGVDEGEKDQQIKYIIPDKIAVYPETSNEAYGYVRFINLWDEDSNNSGIKVTFSDGSGNSYVTETEDDGYYVIALPDNIVYKARFQKNGCISREIEGIDLSDETSIDTGMYCIVPGDVTGNGKINCVDLSLILANLGAEDYIEGDHNSNGIVDIEDYAIACRYNLWHAGLYDKLNIIYPDKDYR